MAVALPFAAVACGGDDGLDSGPADLTGGDDDSRGQLDELELDEFADEINDATGASGASGMLIVEGNEFPIEAATCILGQDTVEVGTTGGGYRILVSGDPSDPSLQILDSDGVQWFDGDPSAAGTGGKLTVEGTTLLGEENTWWNNQNDDVITASFVIECP